MKFGRQAQSPIDDQLAEADIQDRLQLANTLRQRSMEGASLDNVGGHLIGSPWARALSSAAQGIQGAGERKRAYTMATDLATSKRERLAQALGGAGQDRSPDGMIEFGTRLLNDPATADVGQFYIQAGQKAKERAAAREAEAARWQHQEDVGAARFREQETAAERRHREDMAQRAAADAARLAAIQARGPHSVPGTGTMASASDGFVRINPQTNQPEYVVIDGKRPLPGAYDPNNKQDMAMHAGIGKADATYWATRPAAKAARDSLMTDLKTLRDMPGFTSVFGAIGGRVPDVMPAARDARAQLNKVIGGMTAENRQKLVGQGSVSDYEGRLMERASTVLSDPSISDEMALGEVNKILDDLQSGRYAPDAPSSALPDQPEQPMAPPAAAPVAPRGADPLGLFN